MGRKRPLSDERIKERLFKWEQQQRRPRFYSGFSSPKIDKIMKERLTWNRDSQPRKQPSSEFVTKDEGALPCDPISRLPEDILASIISLISTREAACTSILSKRWRYIWKRSLNLDFDAANMGVDIYSTHGLAEVDRERAQKKSRFVEWVNHILTNHEGSKIDSLMVDFPLGESEDYVNDVDQWIELAVEKKVEKLSINLYEYFARWGTGFRYNFPCQLFTQAGTGSLKHLTLSFVNLCIPPNFSLFDSLISLTLERSHLEEETLKNILSSCSLLEWFSVTACKCPSILKFAGGCSSLKLRHLKIFHCPELKEVQVYDAINLDSFECAGVNLQRLVFKNCAQPARLCLFLHRFEPEPLSYTFGGFTANFPQVETLFLSSSVKQVDLIPKQLPTLHKLKKLVLAFDSMEVLVEATCLFLRAAPFLDILELGFPLVPEEMESRVQKKIQTTDHHEHRNLKQVLLYNFQDLGFEYDMAIYILNNAVVLEQMTIYCHSRRYLGDGEWFTPSYSLIDDQTKVHNRLEREVTASTKLVVA